MRILYGVVGEGMGHAMRSSVVVGRLLARGHEVRIVVSGRAAEYLDQRYPGTVTRITGLSMVYEDNMVQKLKTALQNLKALAGVPDNFMAYAEMARNFSPDVVVSDFESWVYWFAKGQNIPILSVDNMQIIARCHHDDDVLGPEMPEFLFTKNFVRAKLYGCNAYLITTFFYPHVKRDRTTLHPPILREVICEAKKKVRDGDHIVVYQSGTSHDQLIDELLGIDAEFRIYGLRRDLTTDLVQDNLRFRPFSETTFIDDLASARAVIAGGGFTLMGEAVFLGKPMLSVPLVGQFEQILNANYLAKLGYGERTSHIDQASVTRFLARTQQYAENLSTFEHDGNEGFYRQLDLSIDQAIAEGSLAI
ncbi:MAG: teichoic acid biosynthesis protein [Deltaproteobacteria bacterium]|nr:teichoic acid biosynthesis protein [Deltaproteobacteria bacterium]